MQSGSLQSARLSPSLSIPSRQLTSTAPPPAPPVPVPLPLGVPVPLPLAVPVPLPLGVAVPVLAPPTAVLVPPVPVLVPPTPAEVVPAPAPTPALTPPPAFSIVHGLSGQLLTPESVTPEDPSPGQSVTVVLDGFLTREQPWTGASVALWPSRNELEAAHIADLVYGLGRRPLMKWTTMDVEAVLEAVSHLRDRHLGDGEHFCEGAVGDGHRAGSSAGIVEKVAAGAGSRRSDISYSILDL